MSEQRFDSLIAGLSAPDQAARLAARDALVAAAIDHMRSVAHRMTRGFPQASLRLTRALDAVVPTDGRHLLNLIATQVRRELIDLARRYAGAESFARYHETNLGHVDGQDVFRSDSAEDPVNPDLEGVSSWTRFHEAADTLNEEDRELFNLVWYLGLSQERAAKALGYSVRTIARRWDVVKQCLVRQLKGQAPT